jgi:anti-sigma B factor antagonist
VTISSLRFADVVVAALSGRIDHPNAELLKQALDPILDELDDGKRALVLDFAGVEYISSMGLRVLMMAAKQMRSRQARIAVAQLQPVVQEIFNISRFNNVVEIFPSVRAALQELSPSAVPAYEAQGKPAIP